VSTFREFTDGNCFWCRGPFRSTKPHVFRHEKTSIESCTECAIDVGSMMSREGWVRVGAVLRADA
jgi:hypothetical protein